MNRPIPILPPALLPGDTVGIVAPASNIDRSALEAGCAHLRKLGYRPYFLDSIFDRDLYFAGSVERRIGELEHMLANPEVRAILCARGGYGTNHLLPHLDVRMFLETPKPFVGYSDITTLLTWLTGHGLVTFHGPMVAKDFSQDDGVDIAGWNATLGSGTGSVAGFHGASPLVPGEAEGLLYGGCLSLLVASLGTPYEIHTEDTILFLEDVNTKPYQLDRMLVQLKLAGKFDRVKGIVFGQMLDCVQPSGQDYSLQQVILRILSGYQFPVAYGIPSGHVRARGRVLPLGVTVKLTVADSVSLALHSAVTRRSLAS